MWVNSRQRYSEIIGTDRFTLSDAFDKAGWHTVSDAPSDDDDWPPGTSFYHFGQLLNRYNVGYQGPKFSYASMPDQYTYAEFQRLELAPGHKPVMADRHGLLALAVGPVANHGALEQGWRRLNI